MAKIKRVESFLNIVLASIITAGLIGVAVTCPNVLQVLKPFLKKKCSSSKVRADEIKKTFRNLERSNLIKIKEDQDEITLFITEKGQKRVLRYNFDAIKINNETKWDGKWRLIISDIPERQKAARDALRRKLLDLGFLQLQKSVWLCPFECKNEIDFLRNFFDVGQYIHYLIVEKLENENFYKNHFSL